MQTIAISNQKGGVGKTSTSINLSAGLALRHKRVLLVDLDPQGHSTVGLGVSTKNIPTIADLLCDEKAILKEHVQPTYIENLSIIPADLSLSLAEMKISNLRDKDFKLHKILSKPEIEKKFDYIIIDCQPTFGFLPINAFVTAKKIIMPVHLKYYSLKGISDFIEVIDMVNNNIASVIKHKIEIAGVLITFNDIRAKLARQIADTLREIFEDKLFKTVIPVNIKLDEAQANGRAIYHYDSKSPACEAYNKFVDEFLERIK